MHLGPVCVVSKNGVDFLPTEGGVDVPSGTVVSIKLLNYDDVETWLLQIIGTDELSVPPPLLSGNVDSQNHLVDTPHDTVTFIFPSGPGRAVGFRSEVVGTAGGGPIATTFGIYSLTTFGTRVGFVTETREGHTTFGWATKLNPLIRSGGGGGGGGGDGGPDNYTLTLVENEEKTIPAKQTMLFNDHVVIGDGGNLIVEGDATDVHTVDNFSVFYVPVHGERVVQRNDEMLFTSDLVVDGQLTVNGQISEATPYDGNDILNVLSTVAPSTPAILGVAPPAPVAFLTPAEARTVMDVPSVAEMNAAIGGSTPPANGLQADPVVKHGDFDALVNHIHYIWGRDDIDKVVTLPPSPSNGSQVVLIGLPIGSGSDWVTLSSDFIIFYNPMNGANVGDRPTFAAPGLQLTLEFKTDAITEVGYDAWYVTNNGVNAMFANLSNSFSPNDSVIANGVLASTDRGIPYATGLYANSVLGRSNALPEVFDPVNPPNAIPMAEGQLLYRPVGLGVIGATPSALVPWDPFNQIFGGTAFGPVTGPGTFALSPNIVNCYIASAGLTLVLPSASHNDEIEIKEITDNAGTAPNSVTLITADNSYYIERIGLGGFVQSDTLTEYKTWIKYKFDTRLGAVWRIVGAAYQLP